MQSNFHNHTQRCKHAFGTEEDYVNAALRCGLTELGFSDHGPFPDKDYGLRMDFDELPDYLAAIDRLSAKHEGKIRLFKGLEIEFHPQYLDYYRTLFTDYHMDYLALGEHTYTEADGSMKNIFFAESTAAYIAYAESIAAAVETGYFAFIAHPDIMFINALAWDKNCEKACDIILSAAEKYDIPLELNANGIRRGMQDYPDGTRLPYPHDGFWSQLRGSKQRVLIGSDCHIPEQIKDSAIQLARQMCRGMELNVIETLFPVSED